MRSFVAVVHDEGPGPDAAEMSRLAAAMRIATSSAPEVAVEGRCGLATVSHEGTIAPVVRAGKALVAGQADDLHAAMRRSAAELAGDFSFAVWDDGELFCARDRFGVWPCYYARIGRGLVVSDCLQAVLAHPDVPAGELNRNAVADYLDIGVSHDPEATIYAGIRRLPPAHELVYRAGAIAIRRYWALEPGPLRAGNDAPARLAAALEQAVADRVNEPSAIVFMSGGLDSTALASITRRVRPGTALLAATSVYRTGAVDVEERFAVEAARSIGIPIRLFPLDDYSPLHSLETGLWTVEPGTLLSAGMTRDIYAAAAAHARLALHGHPADAVLHAEPAPFLLELLRAGRLGKLARALVRYTRVKRRPPYFFIRELLGRKRRRGQPRLPPEWLRDTPTVPAHAIHPLQYADWSSYFEWAHPTQTRAPIRLVYPWLDPAVIATAMSFEPVPWLVDKHVLREMLRGRVSETIRTRGKTYARGDPWELALPLARDLDIVAAEPYIDPVRFRDALARAGALRDATLRAIAFEYWLREMPRRVVDLRRKLLF